MSLPNDRVLLAFFFSLSELKSPLSDQENSELKNLAGQLYHDRQNWEQKEPTSLKNLLQLVQSNEELDRLYQFAKSQIDDIDDEILRQSLPTLKELEQVIPAPQQSLLRGDIPTSPNRDSNDEIPNVLLTIGSRSLHNDNPVEKLKELNLAERIKQFFARNRNKES